MESRATGLNLLIESLVLQIICNIQPRVGGFSDLPQPDVSTVLAEVSQKATETAEKTDRPTLYTQAHIDRVDQW